MIGERYGFGLLVEPSLPYMLETAEDDSGVTSYTYDANGHNVLWETDDLNVLEAEFTYEPLPYAHVVSQHRDAESSFYHFDGVHNTSELTDATEAVTDQYAFDAWGEARLTDGTTANSQLFKGEFLAYHRDPHAGPETAYTLHHRNYAAQTGRLQSEDPATDDLNLYRYVGNNPVNQADPSGLAPPNPFLYYDWPAGGSFRPGHTELATPARGPVVRRSSPAADFVPPDHSFTARARRLQDIADDLERAGDRRTAAQVRNQIRQEWNDRQGLHLDQHKFSAHAEYVRQEQENPSAATLPIRAVAAAIEAHETTVDYVGLLHYVDNPGAYYENVRMFHGSGAYREVLDGGYDPHLDPSRVEHESLVGTLEGAALARMFASAVRYVRLARQSANAGATVRHSPAPSARSTVTPTATDFTSTRVTGKFRGEPFAFGTGTRPQRALKIAEEAATASNVKLFDVVDDVRYVQGNSYFHVDLAGRRIIHIGDTAFRRTRTGQLLEATHELIHAQRYNNVLRSRGGNFVQAYDDYFSAKSFNSDLYALEEVTTELLALRRIHNHLGGISPQQQAASTRYINQWMSRFRGND